MTDAKGEQPDSDKLSPPAMTSGETDADRIARELRAIDLVTALNRAAAAEDAPGRFSLTELMLVVTLLGVVLGLIRGLGMWGGLIALAGSIVLGNVIYPRWYAAEPRRQITRFDCIWGLLMPVVCLLCDPFVLRERATEWKFELRQEMLMVCCLLGWQMVFLAAWLVGRQWLQGFAGVFLGTWIAGITFTTVLGLVLVLPAAMGMLLSVALVGATTFFSGYVLARRIRETIDYTEEAILPFPLLATFGFFAASMLPMQIAARLQLFVKPATDSF